MSNMFKKIVGLSLDECVRLGDNEITPNHIVLALLNYNNNVVEVLELLRVDVEDLSAKIESYLRLMVTNPTKINRLPILGKKSKYIINVARLESEKLGDDTINETHLMLSILKDRELECTKVMEHQDVDYKLFKNKIIETKKGINMSFTDDYNEVGDGKSKKSVSKSETPILDNFGRDVTEIAAKGGIDPIIGRDKEIERVVQILSRRKKNNPILIGEPGCVLGDTKIVVKKISDLSIHTFIDK